MKLATGVIWVRKGGFAILDQGLFAGTNFLANILLARWLDPAQYGAFTVAFSSFLLLTTFHTAILTEPMVVFGAGKYGNQFPQYLGLLISGHWWMTAGIAFLLALAALGLWYTGPDDLSHALLGLSLASPLILLMWLVRRAFYVRDQPQWAAAGGVLYLILMLAGMYALYLQQWLSEATALVMMGIAAAVVSFWLVTLLRPQRSSPGSSLKAGTVIGDHWGYGKWASSAAVLAWVSSNIFYLILPVWVGLEGSAALRAVVNLTMPLMQVDMAISALFIPFFVRKLKEQGCAGLSPAIWLACGGLTLLAVGYYGGLMVFHRELFLWLYGGRYADQTDLLLLAGLTLLPRSVTAVMGPALRAMERLEHLFRCQVVATAAALTVGLWLVAAHGVAGAMAGTLVSVTTMALTMTWVVWRNTMRSSLIKSTRVES
jgi:O-antigen/teichoic acid export membrane protein